MSKLHPTRHFRYSSIVGATGATYFGHFRVIHRRFIAHCYRRGCPAATPRGLQGESCSTAAGFVLRPVKRRQARCKRAQKD